MTKTLIKSRYIGQSRNLQNLKGGCYSCNRNIDSDKKSSLPPELQVFKDKLLSGNGFLVYK